MRIGKSIAAEDIIAINHMPMNFVVGKERSGTTLLQVMLNTHPNIAAPPESRFIVLLYNKYGSLKSWSEENIRNFCDDLFKEGLFRKYWGMDKKELCNVLFSCKGSLSYALVCKIVFLQWDKSGRDITVLFDKNPVYYYFLPTLEKIFPKAKYIYLVRDYRANIASHKRVFKIKNADELAYRWVKIDQLAEKSKLRNPDRYYTLTYELLVKDPSASMKKVCLFLEVPFSEKMVEEHTSSIYASYKENHDESFREIHGSLFQPITSARTNEWASKLSAGEIAEAEAVAGKYGMVKYGYAPISDEPVMLGPARLFYIQLKYRCIKIIYGIVFGNLALYYFVRRKVWKDF